MITTIVSSVSACLIAIQKHETETAYVNEKRERRRADIESARLRSVNEFINTDLLGLADPHNEPDRDLKLREVLDRAARSISGRFDDVPLVKADISTTIATAFRSLGLYNEAKQHYLSAWTLRKQALGKEHPASLSSELDLLWVEHHRGRYQQIAPKCRDIATRCSKQLGAEHTTTLAANSLLADILHHLADYSEAEKLFAQILEIERRVLDGERHSTLGNLANVHIDQGRYDEAEKVLSKLLDRERRTLGEEHPDSLISMHQLATVHRKQRRFAEAEELSRKALEISERILGSEHPHTLEFMGGLANVQRQRGHYEDAQELYNKVLETALRLGDEHPLVVSSMHSLALVHMDQGLFSEAEPLLSKSLEIRRRTLGGEHPDTVNSWTRLPEPFLVKAGTPKANRCLPQSLKSAAACWERDILKH